MPGLLILLGEAAPILFLWLLFRQTQNPPEEYLPAWRPLNVVTKIVVVAGGIVIAFAALRILAVPFVYLLLREKLAEFGKGPIKMLTILKEDIPLASAALAAFVPPYIILKSRWGLRQPSMLPLIEHAETSVQDM